MMNALLYYQHWFLEWICWIYFILIRILSYYFQCIEYLEKSLECSELTDDKNSMAIVYLNISNAHSEMLDNQKAMDCLQKATQVG